MRIIFYFPSCVCILKNDCAIDKVKLEIAIIKLEKNNFLRTAKASYFDKFIQFPKRTQWIQENNIDMNQKILFEEGN